VVDFSALIHSRPQVARALSSSARDGRGKSMPGLFKCADALAARRPEAIVDGFLEGSVALIMDVQGGQAKVVDVEPHRESDAAFARCFGRAIVWAGQPMDAAGAADGKLSVEWPYRLEVESP
jgi:hypothetical protein